MAGEHRRDHLATQAARKDRLDPMLVDDGHVPDGADRGVGSLEGTEPALTLAGEGAMVVVADRSGAGVRDRRPDRRSEERRVGKEWGRPVRTRWSPYNEKKT